jgi:hypothetical protein
MCDMGVTDQAVNTSSHTFAWDIHGMNQAASGANLMFSQLKTCEHAG